MDQTTLDSVKAEVSAGVDIAGTLAGVFAPEFAPFIVLGKAVAKALPDLYNDAQKLLSGQEPSDADNAALAAKIASLADPASI